MKKLLSLILAAVMLFAVIPPLSAYAVTHGFIRGDVNDDSDLSMKDILVLRRFIAGLSKAKDVSLLAADLNADSEIDMKDVLRLRRIIAGLEAAEGNNTDNKKKVGEIKIGGRNISRFTIVYPESATVAGAYHPCMVKAAEELQDYINAACGIMLNISHEPVNNSYSIILKYDDADEYELGKEGYNLSSEENGDFVLTCGRQRGALYAAYGFLEDLIGYRFLPGNIEYLFESDTVEIPAGYSDTQIPGFEYRGIQMAGVGASSVKLRVNALDGGGSANEWNGGGLGTLYIHAHSFAYQMLGFEQRYSDYANDFNNTYHRSQPCMTSEETYEKILDFNYRLIDERESGGQTYGYNYTQISCSSNDNTNYCLCAKCTRIYEAEQSVAGAVIRLANRVAKKMCADYPELDIYTIAYAGGNVAPRYTRPDENVCVCFCTTGCNNHSLRNTDECEATPDHGNPRMAGPIYYGGPVENYANAKDMAYMQSWLEMTDNIYFWYYGANYNFYMSPSPNLFNFYDDIKYLAEKGMIGIYAEGSNDPVRYSFEYLRTYLCSKVLWDPYMSEEEYERHMDEFLLIYYGPGWRDMKTYIYMSNYASDINGCWTNNHDSLWDMYNEEYFKNNYSEMARLLDACLDAARNADPYGDYDWYDHVEMTSVHAHYLGLSATYESDYVHGDDAARAAYKQRYEWLWQYYYDNAATEQNPNGIKGTSTGSGTANLSEFPKNPNNPVNPQTWIQEGYDGHSDRWVFPFGLPT